MSSGASETVRGALPAVPRLAGAVERSRPFRRAKQWLPVGRSLPAPEWRSRHAWLVGVLWAHVLGLGVFAVYRGYSFAHSVLEAAVVAAFAAAASFPALPSRARSALAAVGLVTSSAVLVHISGGFIEAHFHFFVVILILALYEDWIPFLIALGYVVLHHGVAGTLDPELVYNHPGAIGDPWKWAAIHGGFVLAASVGAVVSWRLNENARTHAAEARARAVRSQEANELKSQFLATTSHELRTPLTSIGGFATTLLHRWQDVGDADKVQMIAIIEAQSARLRNLIEDLLVLSAVESSSVPVRPSSVDVGEATKQALSSLGVTDAIAVEIPASLVARVDPRHFEQIVVNLVTNALKYGRPPIDVTAARAHGSIELTVADRGDGIPAEFLPELFEPFTRAPDVMPADGSGLGLSVVRGLVEANGGEVRYEPNRPSGACFRVRLVDAEAPASA